MIRKTIRDFPNYQVTRCGKIYSIKADKFLKPTLDSNYHRVTLFGESGKKKLRVHRIVYESFKGPIPKGMVIDHKDRNRLNNHVDNLLMCSNKENNKADRRGPRGGKRRKVRATCLITGDIKTFASTLAASKFFDTHVSNIQAVLNINIPERKAAKGHSFEYLEETNE